MHKMVKYELLLLYGSKNNKERMLKSKMKYVGIKQVLKVAKNNEVNKVYIGKDAEEDVIKELIETCKLNNIEITYIDTMKELGKLAGIDVEAAAAAGEELL